MYLSTIQIEALCLHGSHQTSSNCESEVVAIHTLSFACTAQMVFKGSAHVTLVFEYQSAWQNYIDIGPE